jgi:alkaline phosphatase D
LGIASGDPTPDGFVLWTRLAPAPLAGGGMTPERVRVNWEVAEDERMQKVVARGSEWADSGLGHSVHVEVRGLRPDRWYWYRFHSGAEESASGRARTTPASGAAAARLAFAFASCQHYEQGYFTAFRHMAGEELDLVIHLGDYIYEGGPQPGRTRVHNGPEITTLDDYRNRYALYKSDPELQSAHAAFPWIVTWDDHEVDNNYAGDIPEDKTPREQFLERRARAYQAYYEHMPLRRACLPRGHDMQLYRSLAFGNLAEFHVLDTRQYRSDQPCGDGTKPRCADALDPRATLLGPSQEQWLFSGLARSRARWNVIAQQVMVAQVDRGAGAETRYSMDQWSGYVAARNRLLGFIEERRPANPVVVTGDIHSNWVADLKADFDDPASPAVAAEFVGTSISSGGDGSDTRPDTPEVLRKNPHVRFFNAQRGYVRCTADGEKWLAEYRVMDFVTRPGGNISTRASFAVRNGVPGVEVNA